MFDLNNDLNFDCWKVLLQLQITVQAARGLQLGGKLLLVFSMNFHFHILIQQKFKEQFA